MPKNTDNITLHIEGMDCANCAQGITKNLEKKGIENVYVNFASGEATFSLKDKNKLQLIIESINSLGYKVVDKPHTESTGISIIEKRLYFTLPFTIVLFFSHMLFPYDLFINRPFVQLTLCIPVFAIGIMQFGKSAWGSIKTGIPNMDVLVFIGSTSAFIYSLTGIYLYGQTHEVHNYLFFETTATIISLVLLGNVLEHRSVKQTTTALKDLSKIQVTTAKLVGLQFGKEIITEIKYEEITVGSILLVNMGDKIPVDGELIAGNGNVDESMLTGESIPVEKTIGNKVIGGTILLNGSIKIKTEQIGDETILAKIIELVKKAQQTKPNIQKLGDKISAIFVPSVLAISVLTFLISFFVADLTLQKSLMSSIAVLVISCPCAMGLATPTAVMVGIGRAAKNGILIKGGNTLEEFAKIKNIVFDKTGTLTTGNFKIKEIKTVLDVSQKEVETILFHIEQHSSHPIAKSIVKELTNKTEHKLFSNVVEEKGIGMSAMDDANNTFRVGSYKIASQLTLDNTHTLYLLKNNQLIATVDIEDELKPNVSSTIKSINEQGIKTIMLSGDSNKRCAAIAKKINISEVYSEQLPDQKLVLIAKLNTNNTTAMVGDGINDAPALSKATVGISLSNGSQIAIQSAQIVLLKENDLTQLVTAYLISKHTLKTIKQNLFWAFAYNIVAIPIAAFGFLNPMIGALAMAFSDVIVIGNSIRLKTKKLS